MTPDWLVAVVPANQNMLENLCDSTAILTEILVSDGSVPSTLRQHYDSTTTKKCAAAHANRCPPYQQSHIQGNTMKKEQIMQYLENFITITS